ncbi:hypothetical protein VPHD479_0315 [Vibrio phage D479]
MYVIYGWDEAEFRCVPCLKAKRMAELKKGQWKGFDFEFKPIPKSDPQHPNRLELEQHLTDMGVELKTLPQVFVHYGADLALIGGFDEFKKHVKSIDSAMWEK